MNFLRKLVKYISIAAVVGESLIELLQRALPGG